MQLYKTQSEVPLGDTERVRSAREPKQRCFTLQTQPLRRPRRRRRRRRARWWWTGCRWRWWPWARTGRRAPRRRPRRSPWTPSLRGTDNLRPCPHSPGTGSPGSSSTAPTMGNGSLHQTSATYPVLPLVTVLWGRYDPLIPPRGQGIVGFRTCLILQHRVPVTIHPNK